MNYEQALRYIVIICHDGSNHKYCGENIRRIANNILSNDTMRIVTLFNRIKDRICSV